MTATRFLAKSLTTVYLGRKSPGRRLKINLAAHFSRQLRNKEGIVNAWEDLAAVAGEEGKHEGQAPLLEESLALYREPGHRGGIATVLGHLGMASWARGNSGQAQELLQETLALFREVGDRRGVARLLGNQALMTVLGGDFARAASLCRESLALYREAGDARAITRYLAVLAGAMFALGQAERAARLFGAAAAQRERLGTQLPPVVRPGYELAIGALRVRLGEPAFASAWAAGQALSLEEATADALADVVLS